VLLVDQNPDAAGETLTMITDEGGEAEVFAADVTSADDCRAMVARAVERWGKLDILDNNVGIGGGGSVVTVDEAEWDRVMEVNVKGMMLASKHAVPAMAAGGGGSIINIASIAALRPSRLTPYATSKGAVIALSQAMAVDHAREGIRVNCVAPGPRCCASRARAGTWVTRCCSLPLTRPATSRAWSCRSMAACSCRDRTGVDRSTPALQPAPEEGRLPAVVSAGHNLASQGQVDHVRRAESAPRFLLQEVDCVHADEARVRPRESSLPEGAQRGSPGVERHVRLRQQSGEPRWGGAARSSSMRSLSSLQSQ
jgi:NAD(P)-dependent dehydrogenase (short-subunit alcohol dehydrogenase family)